MDRRLSPSLDLEYNLNLIDLRRKGNHDFIEQEWFKFEIYLYLLQRFIQKGFTSNTRELMSTYTDLEKSQSDRNNVLIHLFVSAQISDAAGDLQLEIPRVEMVCELDQRQQGPG